MGDTEKEEATTRGGGAYGTYFWVDPKEKLKALRAAAAERAAKAAA